MPRVDKEMLLYYINVFQKCKLAATKQNTYDTKLYLGPSTLL
jgi:hypothetical protein